MPGKCTHNIGKVVVDVFKEAIALGEGGAAVLDEVERPQLTERGQQFLHLLEEEGKVGSN